MPRGFNFAVLDTARADYCTALSLKAHLPANFRQWAPAPGHEPPHDALRQLYDQPLPVWGAAASGAARAPTTDAGPQPQEPQLFSATAAAASSSSSSSFLAYPGAAARRVAQTARDWAGAAAARTAQAGHRFAALGAEKLRRPGARETAPSARWSRSGSGSGGGGLMPHEALLGGGGRRGAGAWPLPVGHR
jgi:hypothetical protein